MKNKQDTKKHEWFYPVFYRSQKSAWKGEYLFKEWYVHEFLPKIETHLSSLKLSSKALLLLDNVPTHPSDLECEGASGIKLLFLPPNVTRLQQPMDQGVIEFSRRKYRQKLLLDVLERLDVDMSFILQEIL